LISTASWLVWALPLIAAAGESELSLDAFLTEFETRRAGVESVQAAFVQDEISPDDAVRSEGTLCFTKPRRIVFRYVEPEIAYLVDGLRVYEYDAEFEQVQIFDLDNNPEAEALFLGFGGDPERLQRAYDLSLSPATPDTCGTQILTLRPKTQANSEVVKESLEDDTAAGSLFEEARITLTEGDLLPCRIEIINDSESRIVINIVQYAVNKSIEDGADRLTLPQGTRIIENDTLTETVGEEGATLPREPVTASDSP
jgi:outer membrane lipoprotein-sorting protein